MEQNNSFFLFFILVTVVLLVFTAISFVRFSIISIHKYLYGLKSPYTDIIGLLYFIFILCKSLHNNSINFSLVISLQYTLITKYIFPWFLVCIAIIIYGSLFVYHLWVQPFLAIIHTPWCFENVVWNIS